MRIQLPGLGILCLGLHLAFAAASAAHAQEAWNAHFQATWIGQAKPAFHSPYAGAHSLSGSAENSHSFTATGFFGWRLPAGAELYVDPELAQGVPMSGLLGLAGFPNGELAKTSGDRPKVYLARAFVRKVVALGGQTEGVASAANQLSGELATHRLVLTAGVLSALDIFDDNALAHDPRMQFMNWALMTHAAYDYPADARGYTRGLAVEYIAGDWALRAGRLAVPKLPNQLGLDDDLLRHYSDQIELSRDHLWVGREGTVRLLAFRTRAVLARYVDALDPGTLPPDLVSARQGARVKWGLGVDLEQVVSGDLGVFGRAFRADGRTETDAFTEADASVSAGARCKGVRWGRAEDVVGLATAWSSLSGGHLRYLQLGGLSAFLGDGALRYGREQVAELYYSASLSQGLSLTADIQRLRNPGYNADRGPVSVFSLRLHWEH